MKRTSTYGTRSNFIASSHASRSLGDRAGRGGVGGNARLKTARAREAIPAAINMLPAADVNASPVFGVPKTAPSHSVRDTLSRDGILLQSARMKTKGDAAAIQPIVPHNRTLPKSCCGSLK